MKYSLHAIPVEVLALAFIEFVFVSTFAAVVRAWPQVILGIHQ